MRVLIKAQPLEREIDGVRLDDLRPGLVREVSTSVGSWLVAEGYAEPEMRHGPSDRPDEFPNPTRMRYTAVERRRSVNRH